MCDFDWRCIFRLNYCALHVYNKRSLLCLCVYALDKWREREREIVVSWFTCNHKALCKITNGFGVIGIPRAIQIEHNAFHTVSTWFHNAVELWNDFHRKQMFASLIQMVVWHSSAWIHNRAIRWKRANFPCNATKSVINKLCSQIQWRIAVTSNK